MKKKYNKPEIQEYYLDKNASIVMGSYADPGEGEPTFPSSSYDAPAPQSTFQENAFSNTSPFESNLFD